MQAQSTFESDMVDLVNESQKMHKDSGTFLNLVIAPPLVTKFTPHIFIDSDRDR